MPHYQLFLQQLRQAREDKGVTQRELGRRLEQHHNFVSSCEMGDRVLNFVEVRAWCRALDVPWLEFSAKLDERLTELDSTETESGAA